MRNETMSSKTRWANPNCRAPTARSCIPSLRMAFNLFLLLLAVSGALAGAQAQPGVAGGRGDPVATIIPIRTDSPRKTLATFLRLQREIDATTYAYRESKTSAELRHFGVLLLQAAALVDLGAVPLSSRRETGETTAIYLMDIFGRVDLPELENIPDVSAIDGLGEKQRWRIPGTPIQIVHIDDGPREGEFLFAASTIQTAPRFFEGIRATPLRSQLGVESWTDAAVQFTGPFIPAAFVDAIPDRLTALWLDTPIWKGIVAILATFGAVILLAGVVRATDRGAEGQIRAIGWRLLRPATLLAIVYILRWFLTVQIDLSGQLSSIVEIGAIFLEYLAWAGLFWLTVLTFFELLILSPSIPEESVDANLVRLIARCIGIVGVIIILSFGAQDLGLPVLSLLTGLGVGGLAVALAIRPTLENLIGGIILYIDKPVRVGDFCSFGDRLGTVEKIGVRSTQLRARDRTLISIPNANFANLELVNWAQIDKMLINATIGVRYETTPDQMRFVLVTLREMMIAHPKIETETVRVRMSEFADFSKNINIRIFALTNDWNEFFAIKEDVLLRVDEIVTKAGVGFAFPSRTLYLGRDAKPDDERGTDSERKVADWRQSGQLPFPTSTTERIAAIDNSLDYPPRGSASANAMTESIAAAAEPLAAPEIEEAVKSENGRLDTGVPASEKPPQERT